MMKNGQLQKFFKVILLLSSFVPALLLAEGAFETEAMSRIKSMENSGGFKVREHTIYGATFVTNLYQSNAYKAIWDEDATELLHAQIQNLKNDGLTPADYWFPSIETLRNKKKNEGLDVQSAVDLDLLLTEAFIRAFYNLLVGKVDPEALDKNFNFPKALEAEKLRKELIPMIKQGKIAETFKRARPANKLHMQLREALKQYREHQTTGGWPVIPEGPTLKPDQKNPRVEQVRAQLSLTGDYTGSTTESDMFDANLETAVKHFQQRHGMDIDGKVGAKTLAAMNVPVEQRIDQIRVNLERQRWYMHESHGEFIVADIAGFQVYWVKNDEIIWNARAQIGKSYTQTPMFKDNIRYIEFNPTWTIPPGIMKRSILPKLKKDPDYLGKKGFLLLTQDGKKVDPKSVDWASIKSMPYIVRQPPGPENALGLVKFMFPNKHAVYLHDTNHRDQFTAASRSFSSGCVRVDKPFILAEKLLAGQDDWNKQKIDEVIASGKTTRVNLNEPMRIVIAYSTAVVRNDQIYFKKDIYSRDARVLKKLDAGFKVRARDK